ncbi:MmgE/PrpD family protein [Chloroflexota bacterium]
MTTIARKFAEYSLRIAYEDLPANVVHQVKRVLLDTLGCAIGGYNSQASTILRSLILELKGAAESTVIGDGLKTTCLYATLANGAMVRYLDFNDTYFASGPVLSGAHPSEIIPPVLAVGERQHSTGKEVIAAIVAGYELLARFADALTVRETLEHRGWNMDLKGGFVLPPVVGKLLNLDAGQMENASGIAGSHAILLGILDAPKEEYTMAKNLRFPLTAHDGILAALLSQKGFTGPVRAIEGQWGFVDSVLHGEFDFEKATDFEGFRIMETIVKSFTSDMTIQGHLTATLHLVKEHDIKPEDVARIRVWANARDVEHTGQPAKRYPRNKETADHSSYYLTAIAIMDRRVGPDQFSTQKYEDPRVIELIDKMIFEADPELDQFSAAGISEITTRQGNVYKHRVDYPRGDPHNPMTDDELEDKFRSMAGKYMAESQMQAIIEAIYNLEKLDNIGELLDKLVFQR